MRRLIAVALVVAGAAFPVCAQRGGAGRGGAVGHSSGFASRGGGSIGPSSGFAAHSAPAFHASFAPVIHSNAVGSSQFRSGGYGASHRNPGIPTRGAGIDHRPRPPYRYERGYIPVYSTGVSYVGPIGPDCFSFGDCGPDDSASNYAPADAPDVNSDAYAQGSSPYANPGGEAEEEQAKAAQPIPFRPTYQRTAPPPEPENPLTLVFKDGRSPEQIRNYMLTRTTLYVQDEHRREIAVSDLDLAATEKANKDAGVAFQLPGAM